MNTLLLNDMVGANAKARGSLIVKSHIKSRKEDCRITNDIYRAVNYFGQVFETQGKRLHKNIKRSKQSTYANHQYWHRNESLVYREQQALKKKVLLIKFVPINLN